MNSINKFLSIIGLALFGILVLGMALFCYAAKIIALKGVKSGPLNIARICFQNFTNVA